MHPLVRPLFALVCLALAQVTQTSELTGACSNLVLGSIPPMELRKVRIQYHLIEKLDEKKPLPVPAIKEADQPLVWVNVTACNPAKGGSAPYILHDDKDPNPFKAEVHCSYRDKIRCPEGLNVELLEHYPDNRLKQVV